VGTKDPGEGKPDPPALAPDAPLADAPAKNTPYPPAQESHGREGGRKKNPAAAVLALCRTSGIELWRRPGRGGAREGLMVAV
jgi:hypothetical protein